MNSKSTSIENTNQWLEKDIVKIGGEEFSINKHKEYQSVYSDYRIHHYSVGNNVFVISAGSPVASDVTEAMDYLEDIFLSVKSNEKYNLIWDLSQVGSVSLKVRRALKKSNELLNKYLNGKYLILNKRLKTFFYVFKIVYPGEANDFFITKSCREAFEAIILKKNISKPVTLESFVKSDITKEELMKHDKEQLADMILASNKEHEERLNQILETIGNISWDGSFKPVPLQVNEEDPDFLLLNALYILQQDAYEIISELKDLNQNLELKVANRIVDIIDKESNLRAILDNSDRVTWLINNRYELIDFNTAFKTEIQNTHKTEPKIHQNFLDLFGDDKDQIYIWKQRFDHALEGKPGIYLDQDVFNDEERVLEIKTFPIKEIGKIKGVSVFIKDITELKSSQLKLIEKNRDLEKVNKELDSFVYRVSHDLRAPLTSILGLLNLIKLERDPEKISHYIELQEKSINRLDLFIKDIINLSRNARLGITVEKIDFEEMTGKIFDSFYISEPAKQHIEKRIKIINDFPLYTDKSRLQTVLSNLISNGFKYANTQQEQPYIEISVNTNEKQCEINVKDNGIGISEIHLPKIWTMFFRATNDNLGSGLGLYIVKEIVSKLKGSISVKSKTRVGTTFKLIIPNSKERYDAAPRVV